jgi:hypothetical protein
MKQQANRSTRRLQLAAMLGLQRYYRIRAATSRPSSITDIA